VIFVAVLVINVQAVVPSVTVAPLSIEPVIVMSTPTGPEFGETLEIDGPTGITLNDAGSIAIPSAVVTCTS
jgi:hypothetical protein